MIFSHMRIHTHSPVHYFSVGWTSGQKDKGKDGGIGGATGANQTFFLVDVVFPFLVINEQCCFLGLMGGGGGDHVVLGD